MMIELKNIKNTNEYQFVLKANNGQILFNSEKYSSKNGALEGINVIKTNAKYERKTAKNGKFYFNLKTINNQIIGSSQMYSSESGMENGIKSVKENVIVAEVTEV